MDLSRDALWLLNRFDVVQRQDGRASDAMHFRRSALHELDSAGLVSIKRDRVHVLRAGRKLIRDHRREQAQSFSRLLSESNA
jgi:ribosomal protein S19E (S16A)